MTVYEIEVRAIAGEHDVQARRLAREILNLPMIPFHGTSTSSPSSPLPTFTLRTAHLYHISGTLSPIHVENLTRQLLIDPVVQGARIVLVSEEGENEWGYPTPRQGLPLLDPTADYGPVQVVDVFFHAGVTDTLGESVQAGARMLGITNITSVTTGHRYFLDGRLSKAEVQTIIRELLYNPVIQQYTLHFSYGRDESRLPTPADDPHPVAPATVSQATTPHGSPPAHPIPLSTMNEQELLDLSKSGMLALNLEEMQAIQLYFRLQGREPTDVELETLAQTWSEHCSHKTFKAMIEYREVNEQGELLASETIDGLLKHYIMRATADLESPWVVSAFSDNAGIVRFTGTHDLAFKVETHNHPSAIEPFGGANTGVGGVIRDVLGVSAWPIACTDILCFGPPDTEPDELPPGMLSPRRIASGVVNGVRDYGNKMGIPTVNGAILYQRGYLYNPLVFCGCLGILPHGSHPRNAEPGDLVVVLGGRTGRDGIHGATFSSGEMSSEINAQAGSAVQIGAPITEKKVADVIIQARDRRLYHAITDCGAGGFSSAVGEMGAETGVRVELARAPLKYQGLLPWEIWLSEAQERMVLAVPPEHLEALLDICATEEVEASIIGTFTGDHRLLVTCNGETVADLDMDFLHKGRPARTLEAVWTRPGWKSTSFGRADSSEHTGDQAFSSTLLALLRHPTIASKEAVVRRYDHEVQGATVLKPLVGRAGNGPGDAAVLQPMLAEGSKAGIILANGINPLYGQIDTYCMALNAVDEALRNLTAVGGDIERAAILDNFCWGNSGDPQQLGLLVRAVKGCHDAAIGFGTPFISGKDSLNNEYRLGDQRLPVIPTLLISAVGVIDDAAQTVDMSLKERGNLLYMIGLTRNELAGSHYAGVQPASIPGTTVPQVDLSRAREMMKALGAAIRKGLVRACHDLAEGGLAVAAAEMALAGLLGMDIDVGQIPQHVHTIGDSHINTVLLFSESASRFLAEVAPEQQEAFEEHMRTAGVQHVACIGIVTNADHCIIRNGEQVLIDVNIASLQAAWKGETA